MTGAILLAFVLYAYIPYALFKTFAERFIDLGRKKDSTQVEEIFSAAIPAIILHAQALILLELLALVWSPLRLPRPAWNVLASLGEPGGYGRLAALLDGEFGVVRPISYLALVAWLAAFNGSAFGRGMLMALKSPEPADFIGPLQPLWRRITAKLGWRWFWQLAARLTRPRTYVAGYSHLKNFLSKTAAYGWKLFYLENLVSAFSWQAEEPRPFMFVKTKDGSLFHGQFSRYDKKTDGDLEAIYLTNVSRFSRLAHREAIARFENPIHPLYGTLYLKWAEVVDVNVTLPGVIQYLYQKYEKDIDNVKTMAGRASQSDSQQEGAKS